MAETKKEMTKEEAEQNEQNKALTGKKGGIVAMSRSVRGRRRGGFQIFSEKTFIPYDKLTEAKIKELESDPELLTYKVSGEPDDAVSVNQGEAGLQGNSSVRAVGGRGYVETVNNEMLEAAQRGEPILHPSMAITTSTTTAAPNAAITEADEAAAGKKVAGKTVEPTAKQK